MALRASLSVMLQGKLRSEARKIVKIYTGVLVGNVCIILLKIDIIGCIAVSKQTYKYLLFKYRYSQRLPVLK